VGSGQGVSLNQLLAIIEGVVQKPFSVERVSARPFDVPKLILDTQRAGIELSWRPEVQLEEGISRTWNWIRALQWLSPMV
jgi:UDP-glucose 4-epimerase